MPSSRNTILAKRLDEAYALIKKRDAQIVALRSLRHDPHMSIDGLRLRIVNEAIRWYGNQDEPMTGLLEALHAHAFATWAAYVDECFGCGDEAPVGSMFVNGVDDQGLCRECAADWRKEPREGAVEVWGPRTADPEPVTAVAVGDGT
jgi:hypothetical protein